jgi:hypothetical protein
MLQASLDAADHGRPPNFPAIQFYSVEITPLADGQMSVGMSATICEPVDEGDFELVNMDMASTRVDTIDQALAVIREALQAATAAKH